MGACFPCVRASRINSSWLRAGSSQRGEKKKSMHAFDCMYDARENRWYERARA
jgi:hypothetical protein